MCPGRVYVYALNGHSFSFSRFGVAPSSIKSAYWMKIWSQNATTDEGNCYDSILSAARHSGGSKWKREEKKNIINDYLTTYQTAGRVCSNWESSRVLCSRPRCKYFVIENKCNSRSGALCELRTWSNRFSIAIRNARSAADFHLIIDRFDALQRNVGAACRIFRERKCLSLNATIAIHKNHRLRPCLARATCAAPFQRRVRVRSWSGCVLALSSSLHLHLGPSSTQKRWWITIKSFKLLII